MTCWGGPGPDLATNGQLDGAAPVPPAGVLATARSAGRDVVTWQPRAGVRVAAVAVGWSGGSVMAGRSLRLTEEREDHALVIAALAWLVGMAGLAVAVLVADRLVSGRTPPSAQAPAA
jgi:hypothetical protein